MGGFRVLPSLGSCNKETLACRDCALPTWRPSPVTLGRGEGNAEAHSSWPQRDACQPSSRRRGAALCLASACPLSQDAALKSLTQPALHGPGRVRRAGDAPSLPCLPVSPRNPGGFGAQGRLLPGGLGWSGTGGMRQGPRLRCCLCFWLTPPRPPHPAFGWTSPVCAPSGEGLQLLPGLALESQDWDRTPALPFR